MKVYVDDQYKKVKVQLIRGNVTTDLVDQDFQPPVSLNSKVDLAFEFTIDVEEYFTVVPNYATDIGGSSQDDGPDKTMIVFSELPRIGGQIAVKVTIGGEVVSDDTTAITQAWFDAYYSNTGTCNVAKEIWCQKGSAMNGLASWAYPDPIPGTPEAIETATVTTLNLMGVSLSREDVKFSESRSNVSTSVDLTDKKKLYCFVRLETGFRPDYLLRPVAACGSENGYYWDAVAFVLPSRYRLLPDRTGTLGQREIPQVQTILWCNLNFYPDGTFSAVEPGDSGDYEWVNKAGYISLLDSPLKSVGVGVSTFLPATFTAERWHSAVLAYLDPNGLRVSGNDVRDWRLTFRGYRWDALRISKTSSLLIDDCTSIDNWVAGPNTTLSEHITSIEIAAANLASGSVTLTIPASVRMWEGYRYLRFTGSASVPMDLTVSIAGRIWHLTFDASSQDVLLDLCCATDDPNPVSSKGSRFPVAYGAFPWTFPPQEQYSLGWGVNYCNSLIVSGITSGESVTFSGVSLVCKGDESALTLLEPFLSTVQASSQSSGRFKPYAFIQTDGRISDWPAWPAFRIDGMRQMLSYVAGFTVDALPSPDDGYHGINQQALCLGGDGSTYDWSTKTWKDWIDVPLSSSPLVIPAQDLFDGVIGYPGIGNPFDGSPYPGPDEDDALPLVTRKILRAQGTGMAFLPNGAPHEGIAITARTMDGLISGVGIAKADANYRTIPSGFGGKSTETLIDGASSVYSATQMWQNRQRVRTSFRLTRVPGEGTLPNLWCPAGEDGSTCSVESASVGSCSYAQVQASPLPMA